MLTLTCQRCEHEWDYTGQSQYYATCPCCKSSVKVDDDSSNESSKHSGTSDGTEPSTQTVELATGDMVREVAVTEAVEDLHETISDHGAAQEAIRQRVGAIEDDRDEQGEQIEEIAVVLKELVEALGGEGEYETVDIDSGDETAASGVAEAAKAVEVDG